jgi:hypothetical protein
MFFRRKKLPPQDEVAHPERQYWDRDPKPSDPLMIPDAELISEDRPAEVFSDEIDPEWADEGTASPED